MFKTIISLLRSISNALDEIEFNDHVGITEHRAEELIANVKGSSPNGATITTLNNDIQSLTYQLYNDDAEEGALGDIVKTQNAIAELGKPANTSSLGQVKPDGNTLITMPDGTLVLNSNYDCVIEQKVFGNGESGYRKWRNGRLEQWGVATTNTGETEFLLHTTFKDQLFGIQATVREKGNFYIYALPSANQKMKVRIADQQSNYVAIKFQWKAEGYWK